MWYKQIYYCTNYSVYCNLIIYCAAVICFFTLLLSNYLFKLFLIGGHLYLYATSVNPLFLAFQADQV